MSGESDVEQEESDDDGIKENDDYGSSQDEDSDDEDEDSDDEDEDSDDEEAKLRGIISAQEAKIERQEAMILDYQKRIAANSTKRKDTDTESLAWFHKLRREYQICERGRRLGGRIFFVLGPFSCLCYLPPLTELCEGSNNNKNPLFQCPTLQLVELVQSLIHLLFVLFQEQLRQHVT